MQFKLLVGSRGLGCGGHFLSVDAFSRSSFSTQCWLRTSRWLEVARAVLIWEPRASFRQAFT